MKRILYALCLFAIVGSGCGNHSKKESGSQVDTIVTDTERSRIAPRYAQGFDVTYTSDACLLDIHDPQKEKGESFHYALVPRGNKPSDIPEGYTVIETPVKSVICMTSLQLSNFIKLDALDAVAGITSTRHLFNEEMSRRLEEGKAHK